MNSWMNPQQQQMNTNMVSGGASFSPYWGMQQPNYNYRAPVYRADPIHGENAAWQFPIGGGEIYLPDADKDIIWWIRVDNNGNKTVTPFDVKLHEEPKPVDTNDLAARLAAVEEWINGKSNKSNAKRSAGATATVAGPVATTSIE